MATPPEEAIHRLAAGFSDHVPHRDFDATNGRHDRGPSLVLVTDHAANHRLDVERIAPQDLLFGPLVDERLDGFLLPLQRCLTDTRQASVGREPNKEVIP